MKEFGHGEIQQNVTWSQIPMDEIIEIAQILHPHRFVQMKYALNVGFDFGRYAAFHIERAARCHMHQEKRDRNDQKQRRDGGQKPPQDITQHGAAPHKVPPAINGRHNVW